MENISTIVVLGGRYKTGSGTSTFSKAVFSYHTNLDVWIEKAELPYLLSAGTSVSMANEGILLFGGDRGEKCRLFGPERHHHRPVPGPVRPTAYRLRR